MTALGTPAGGAAVGGAHLDSLVALRAVPLLAQFNVAGVLSAADVHVAQRLGRLAGEPDERVLLAVALTVRAVRGGSVCVALDDVASLAAVEDEDAAPDATGQTAHPGPPGGPAGALPWPEPSAWRAAVLVSPLVAAGVGGPADRPVRWVDGRLYLDRYWRQEKLVRSEVDRRLGAADPPSVDPSLLAAALARLFPGAGNGRQRLAAATSAVSRITVLTGGPGTGKTTTVARIIAVLQCVAGPGLRVGLAAPTGKAAARLQEAVAQEVAALPAEDQHRVGDLRSGTLHRLLGWQPGTSTRFRHHRAHHLPHDVVVVDETSMVSLPLMASLLEALRPQARLLLVGDPDQLASVEAGAVLGDLVARPAADDRLVASLSGLVPHDVPSDGPTRAALANGVVRLTTVHRHGPDIGALATAIRDGRPDDVVDLLRRGGPAIEFVETGDELTDATVAAVRRDVEAAGRSLVRAARAGDARAALQALEEHRLLVAHRRGPVGVAHWAGVVEGWVARAADLPDTEWYLGRPLLVTTNDRDTGLYNGDTGVVISDGAQGSVVVLGDPDRPLRVRPHRLPPVQTVHAMTVHRGQGSQFVRVSLLLPPARSPLLTRELLYTAVTRARELVRVVGTEASVRAAVERPVRRASGLRDPLPAT